MTPRASIEFKEELSVVEKYLVHREYPNEFSKAEKANIRRKCGNNYKMEDGVLHYRKNVNGKESMWRTCIRSDEEKKRVMESCHNGLAAGLRNESISPGLGISSTGVSS